MSTNSILLNLSIYWKIKK